MEHKRPGKGDNNNGSNQRNAVYVRACYRYVTEEGFDEFIEVMSKDVKPNAREAQK